MTSSSWLAELTNKLGPLDTLDGWILYEGIAGSIAQKAGVPPSILKAATAGDYEDSVSTEQKQPAIAKVDRVVVSKATIPTLETQDVWLSTYHLELIKELIDRGFKVVLMDENQVEIGPLGEENCKNVG